MREYKISNKQLMLFLTITFGLTILMGLVMYFAYSNNYEVDVFPLIQMYYPTIGVILSLLLINNKDKELPRKFYITYLIFTFISILYVLVKLFAFHIMPSMTVQTEGIILGSVLLIIAYCSEEKDILKSSGLTIKRNIKESIIYLFISILLCLCVSLLCEFTLGRGNNFLNNFKDSKKVITLILLPIIFLLSFIPYLGEEYGWRYFLQNALQERLGKIKGVIVLGIIWAVWHLPLNLMYYSPETPIYCFLNQLICCIECSIFLGFVYMKTKNIWLLSMIHYLGNNIDAVISGSMCNNIVFDGKSLLISIIYSTIVYVPFLFTKQYRKTAD